MAHLHRRLPDFSDLVLARLTRPNLKSRQFLRHLQLRWQKEIQGEDEMDIDAEKIGGAIMEKLLARL